MSEKNFFDSITEEVLKKAQEKEHHHKIKLRTAFVFALALFLVALAISFMAKQGVCYSEADNEYVEKTRFEIIIDYVKGVEYQNIDWEK